MFYLLGPSRKFPPCVRSIPSFFLNSMLLLLFQKDFISLGGERVLGGNSSTFSGSGDSEKQRGNLRCLLHEAVFFSLIFFKRYHKDLNWSDCFIKSDGILYCSGYSSGGQDPLTVGFIFSAAGMGIGGQPSVLNPLQELLSDGERLFMQGHSFLGEYNDGSVGISNGQVPLPRHKITEA